MEAKTEKDNLKNIIKNRKAIMDKLGSQWKWVYHNALFGGGSQAIKAKCYDCVCFDKVAESVKDCRGFSCSLYFQRPYQYEDTQRVKKTIKEQESILMPKIEGNAEALNIARAAKL